MPLYNFTVEELEALREVVARVRSGRLGTPSIPRFIDDTGTSPEVYVALTPPNGIPGAGDVETGTGSADLATAGSAVCTLCDIANTYAGASGSNEIRTLGYTETVYNLGTVAIPGDRYIVVARLKTGGWVAVGGGGGGEPGGPTETLTGGSCDLASLRPGDCLTVRTTDQGAFRLHWDGNGHWVGTGEFSYTGGAGTFDYFYSEGRQRLKLDGLDLLGCGDGCWAGGALTGHSDELGSGTGMGMTGTGTGFAECAGEVFKVCVECSCCLESGWYCVNLGGGCTPVYLDEDDVCDADLHNKICSGPYASYALAAEVCSVDLTPTAFCNSGACTTLPATVIANLTSNFAGCDCLNGTYTLVWDPNPLVLAWTATVTKCSTTVTAYLRCIGNVPSFWIACADGGQWGATQMTGTCNPVNLSGNLPKNGAGCCTGTVFQTIAVAITPAG